MKSKQTIQQIEKKEKSTAASTYASAPIQTSLDKAKFEKRVKELLKEHESKKPTGIFF